MSAVIAKTAMGLCSCGSQIEQGEYVLLRNDGAIHVGCPERTAAASQTTPMESSGFLFGGDELATIEHAKEVVGVNHISFDGATVLGIDTRRLAGQLAKVYGLMKDGRFRTLSQIASVAGCLETSASARLRDLRKARFGNHSVVSHRVEGTTALYEYRLVANPAKGNELGRRAA